MSTHSISLLLGMFAGLRRGEVINLNVDRDVDFTRKTITVRGAASFSEGNQATVTEGKTKAAQRVIPLNDCLANALRFHHGLLCAKQDGSMMSLIVVFSRKPGPEMLSLNPDLNPGMNLNPRLNPLNP